MSTQVEAEGRPKLPILTLVIIAGTLALFVAGFNPLMNLIHQGSSKGMDQLQQATGSIEDAARAAVTRP